MNSLPKAIISTESKRIEWIDIFKGIAVLLMVIGHSSPPATLNQFIYLFHMGAFFFISGYSSRLEKKPLLKVVANKLYTILLPYFVLSFGFIGFAWVLAKLNLYHYFFINDFVGFANSANAFFNHQVSVEWLGATWFLVALFSTFVVQKIILLFSKNKIGILYVILSFAVFNLGFYLIAIKWFSQTWYLDIVFIAQLYFAMGLVFKEFKVFEKAFHNNNVKYVLLPVLFVILFILGKMGAQTDYPTRNVPLPFLAFTANILGFFFIYIISDLIAQVPKLKNQFILFGKNTLGLLFFNFAALKVPLFLLFLAGVIPLAKIANFLPEAGNWYWWIVAIVATYVCVGIWVLLNKSKFIGFLLGQNNKFKILINKAADIATEIMKKHLKSFGNYLFEHKKSILFAAGWILIIIYTFIQYEALKNYIMGQDDTYNWDFFYHKSTLLNAITDTSSFDRFRPFVSGVQYLLNKYAFGTHLEYYYYFNIITLLCIAFLLYLAVFKITNRKYLSFFAPVGFLISRFCWFGVSQAIGSVENFAILFMAAFILCLIEFREKKNIKYIIWAAVWSMLAIFTHERFAVLPIVMIIVILITSNIKIIKKLIYTGITIIPCVLYFICIQLLQVPIFARGGTGGSPVELNFASIFSFFKQGLFNILVGPKGPLYLAGLDFTSPDTNLFFTTLGYIGLVLSCVLFAFWIKRMVSLEKSERVHKIKSFICLALLMMAILSAGCITIRLEMRFVYPAFAVFLVLCGLMLNDILTAETKNLPINRYNQEKKNKNSLVAFFVILFLVCSFAVNNYAYQYRGNVFFVWGQSMYQQAYEQIITKYKGEQFAGKTVYFVGDIKDLVWPSVFRANYKEGDSVKVKQIASLAEVDSSDFSGNAYPFVFIYDDQRNIIEIGHVLQDLHIKPEFMGDLGQNEINCLVAMDSLDVYPYFEEIISNNQIRAGRVSGFGDGGSYRYIGKSACILFQSQSYVTLHIWGSVPDMYQSNRMKIEIFSVAKGAFDLIKSEDLQQGLFKITETIPENQICLIRITSDMANSAKELGVGQDARNIGFLITNLFLTDN